MWRLKQFMPKDQAGLEGKSVEVGSLRLQVRNVIAEGGFSSVYLARDAQTGKNFALKHIICNDGESLDLVRKEVAVMKILRGHPNIVTLHAHAIFDNGRTKECFLAMDCCQKTLVNVLEGRGAGFFEEKQLLLIFRDLCNAVCGMHSQAPPIAHRDLKAENVLMDSNGAWKLCDFGSTSTNHKIFEKSEEMGLEEDIIRKHTTPAYRAPEMWDLYQRELISEKVDIWALGCLLYRLAFFKSAFDGESKLQILNGNYRIPDAPKYSDLVIQLIKDMLTASPEARPDIMQVWRRINEGLPPENRKSSPDRTLNTQEISEARPSSVKAAVTPSRSPPAPPPSEPVKHVGSFWATPYAADAKSEGDTSSRSSVTLQSTVTPPPPSSGWSAEFGSSSSQRNSVSPPVQQESSSGDPVHRSGKIFKKSGVGSFVKKVQGWNREEGEGEGYTMISELKKEPETEPRPSTYQSGSAGATKVAEVSNDGAFNAFVAEFDNSAMQAAEMEKLRMQLKQALAERSEFAGKYEKLTAICRSQRQEIQELKSALAAAATANAPSSTTTTVKEPAAKPTSAKEPAAKPPQSRRTRLEWHSSTDQGMDEKQNGSVWDLQSGQAPSTNSSDSSSAWQAFGDPYGKLPGKSSETVIAGSSFNGGRRQQHHSRAASVSGADTWGFIQDNLSSSAPSYQDQAKISAAQGVTGSSSFRAPVSDSSRTAAGGSRSQPPAGWAGF